MSSSRINTLTWMNGSSGWALYCAVMSVFGLTGYYSHFLRGHIPDWLGVGILILPVLIIVMIQWGELPSRVVAIAHIIADSWFMILALGMEIGHAIGHKPDGTNLARILAHVGWTFAWGNIYRQAKLVHKNKPKQ